MGRLTLDAHVQPIDSGIHLSYSTELLPRAVHFGRRLKAILLFLSCLN
jgi:hypothetical protein